MQGGAEQPRFTYSFSCTRCGECCRWPGHVLLHDADITRLARGVGLDEDRFIQRYAVLASNRGQLSLAEDKDGACIFLDGARCSVYEERPAQCRAFPFPATSHSECPGLRVEVAPVEPGSA